MDYPHLNLQHCPLKLLLKYLHFPLKLLPSLSKCPHPPFPLQSFPLKLPLKLLPYNLLPSPPFILNHKLLPAPLNFLPPPLKFPPSQPNLPPSSPPLPPVLFPVRHFPIFYVYYTRAVIDSLFSTWALFGPISNQPCYILVSCTMHT